MVDFDDASNLEKMKETKQKQKRLNTFLGTMVFKANPVKTLGHIGHTGHIIHAYISSNFMMFFPWKGPENLGKKPEPRAFGDLICKTVIRARWISW